MAQTIETKRKDLIERMFKVGAHFGYSKSRRHPSVSSFIFGTKNRVELFDLEKTSELLEGAVAFAENLGREGKTLLFVGGKNEARDAVKNAAESVGMPFVTSRWVGGTLTNFGEVKKRLNRLAQLREERERGELAKYTKRERLLIDREITSLEDTFGGIAALTKLPDALCIVDTRKETIAVAEAKKMRVPVIGLLNSDCNTRDVDFPVVANDATLASVSFFVNEIAGAYKRGTATKIAPQVAPTTQE